MKDHPASAAGERVMITGMGCVAPSGIGSGRLWRNLLAGRGAIRELDDLPGYPRPPRGRCNLGATVADDALTDAWPAGAGRPARDRCANLLTAAAEQAVRQAGMSANPELCADVPVLIGSGAGAPHALFDVYRTYFENGGQRLRPTSVPRAMANGLSAGIAMRWRLTGPNYVIVSACASATAAIGTAFRMVRHGLTERALCGGVDSVFDPVTLSAWDRLGVLTRRANPALAVLPFDRRRDGFVLGEGAGVLILESLASARSRGIECLGEIAGYGESSDATHITQPDWRGQSRAIVRALDDAAVDPGGIGLVIAHGTATVANDRCESRALHTALGSAAGKIPVLSLKPFFGHLLGASGAVETILGVRALRAGTLPPDPLREREPDPECPLAFCPPHARNSRFDFVLKSSFAFGGNNAVLVLRRAGPGREPTDIRPR